VTCCHSYIGTTCFFYQTAIFNSKLCTAHHEYQTLLSVQSPPLPNILSLFTWYISYNVHHILTHKQTSWSRHNFTGRSNKNSVFWMTLIPVNSCLRFIVTDDIWFIYIFSEFSHVIGSNYSSPVTMNLRQRQCITNILNQELTVKHHITRHIISFFTFNFCITENYTKILFKKRHYVK